MKDRNTAGKLGFIKDSEGVYRKGSFIYKDGKIIHESNLVPEGTIEDVEDNFTTMAECIRSVLSYSTTLGEPARSTDVYIDKVGNNYKPSNKLSKNTVAVVTSQRQVIEIKAKDITNQDDNKELENKDAKDKPVNPKEIKSFSSGKPKNIDELKESDLGVDKEVFIKKLYATNTPYEVLNLITTALPDGDLKDEAISSWVYYKDRNRDMNTYHDLIADLLDTMEGNPTWHKDRLAKEIHESTLTESTKFYNTEEADVFIEVDNGKVINNSAGKVLDKEVFGLVQNGNTIYVVTSGKDQNTIEAYSVDSGFPYEFKVQ